MVESAYQTDERAGNIPLLKRLRTDYHFTHSVTSVWRLGPLEVKRNHHPRQVVSYTWPTEMPDLFAEDSLDAQPLSERRPEDDPQVTVITLEAQQEATRRWREGTFARSPNWSKAHSEWAVALSWGDAFNHHAIELKLC